jgi:hypothetical protein
MKRSSWSASKPRRHCWASRWAMAWSTLFAQSWRSAVAPRNAPLPFCHLVPKQRSASSPSIPSSHHPLTIKVRTFWRTANRKMFSHSSVARKISVRDIRDLKIAVDRKQPRLTFV